MRISRAMTFIPLDETRAPIMATCFPPELVIEDYENLVGRYVVIAQRGQRVVWLHDLRNFNPIAIPSPVRKAAADLALQHLEILKSVSVAEARVVTNHFVRGLSSAFTWLTGAPWPTQHFKTMQDAETWLRTQLAKDAAARTAP